MKSRLLGRNVELADAFWFLRSHREIFVDQVYKFSADRSDPLILDCGANIGMSVIYFKHSYPDARIIAFEPDAEIFAVLRSNVEAFGFQHVTTYQQAVWKSDTELCFQPDGSVGGRVVLGEQAARTVRVAAVRLKRFLDQRVDLLKLDIEGAEYDVLRDCQHSLGQVENLFVEYHGSAKETQKLHEILLMMQDAGFRYHIKEANPVAHPFMEEELNPLYDLQLNIFGFRRRSRLE